MIASGFGINVKLIGSFKPNPETGQVTAYFEDLPQVPFEDFQLHLFSGERALMATPIDLHDLHRQRRLLPLGRRAARTAIEPGLRPRIRPARQPNAQARSAPSTRPSKPAPPTRPPAPSSSFTLKLNREDGDQYLGKLNFTMPPGPDRQPARRHLLPRSRHPAAAKTLGRTEQAEPSCPASSEIGTSNVAAGPGSHPFHAVGKIYLAGPFQGAPLTLVAITPALAGPYDYGTVVVRVALHIDPADAHVIADSETVPEIIGGIPLRMREIEVNIDTPNFMINPTNCSPFSVGSEGIGDQGTAASFSSYFHAVNCAALAFTPKMTITQLGGHKVDRPRQGAEPAIRPQHPPRRRQHQIGHRHPAKSLRDRPGHLGNLCDKAELAADQCAGQPAIGTVKDETPLLEKPLEGPAYAVSGFGVLPHVAFILGGQVTVMPEAESTSVNGGELKTVDPGRPRRPDRPLPPHPLRRHAGLPRKHPEPLRRPDRLHGRIQRPKRQDRDPAGEGEDRLQGKAPQGKAPPRPASRMQSRSVGTAPPLGFLSTSRLHVSVTTQAMTDMLIWSVVCHPFRWRS